MGNVKHIAEYEVCRTGKLSQFYTLFIHRQVTGDGFSILSRSFIQNLAHDEQEAWEKAQEIYNNDKDRMTAAWGDEYFSSIDIIDSPKREYCDLKAFGYEWKKTPKGFRTYPDNEFWTLWRQYKTPLKEAGFSVFKGDDLQFILFYRNTTEENMIKAFELLDKKKSEQVIEGEYVGEVKERLRGMRVTVESVYKGSNHWGDFQTAVFIGEGGIKLRTKYGGQKQIEEGSVIDVDATVKDHKVFDGHKVTLVNRISFKDMGD